MKTGREAVTKHAGGRFTIKRESIEMRVPDVVLKCVVFIGEVASADSEELQGDLLATGFLVSVPSVVHAGISYIQVVTARHIAKDLEGKEAYFSVNKKGGGTTHIVPFGDHWWLHPTDPTADVAILPCAINPGEVDIQSVRTSLFVTPDSIGERGIGIGDEVFVTGLFTPSSGIHKNIPIVRYGNIAMLPDQQIDTELGFADVYLIEARSIGGVSGSPVFVRETVKISGRKRDGSEAEVLGCGKTYLLGMMHGHWDIKESEINKPSITHNPKHGVNLGIGIVVPCHKILETLNQPGMVDIRRAADEQKRKEALPGMDTGRRSEEE